MEELQNQINFLKNELEDLRYILSRKTGLGPADIKGKIVAPSNVGTVVIENSSITNAKMADDSIKQAELDTETVAVTVTAGGATGTATVTSGSIVLGWRPTGNNDQFVDNISIS